MFNLDLLIALGALLAFLLVLVFLVTWLGAPNRESLVVALHDFGAARIDFLQRLWRFWGPRLGDANFLAAAVKLVAGGLGVAFTDGAVQMIVLTLTLVGAFLFQPWAHLPFEKLDPPSRPAQA
jgi:hypothetical protein